MAHSHPSPDTAPNELASGERRLLLCLDDHDLEKEGAGDAMLSSIIANNPSTPAANWTVRIFGHVHKDSNIPLVKRLGNLLGMHLADRAERAALLRTRAEDVAAALEKDLAGQNKEGDDNSEGGSARPSPRKPVKVVIDEGNLSMLEAYPRFIESFRPEFIVLNERNDSETLLSPFGAETVRLHRKLEGTTPAVIVVKKKKKDFGVRHKHHGQHHGPGQAVHLVLIDPMFHERSSRAVEVAAKILGESGEKVHFVSCWALPDFATAMYADDLRWAEETKKQEQAAQRAVKAAATHFFSVSPSSHMNQASLHTFQDTPLKAVEHYARKLGPCNVVVGGGVIREASGRRRSTGSVLGLAKKRVFGTTADSVLQSHDCGAVTIAY